MSSKPPIPPEKTKLLIRGSSGLAVASNSGSSALSEIVSRSLVHIQTSKDQWVLHRIGRHDLYGPDYRLVCAWAEELKLTEDEVLVSLLSHRTILNEGHFRRLNIHSFLPISSFPSINGLMIEELELHREIDFSGLKTISLAHLIEFTCESLDLDELDLSPFPRLERLQCQYNKISQLDLSCVPYLRDLCCWDNNLTDLDLSKVPNLTNLQCGNEYYESCLINLNFSDVPNLEILICHNMQIKELDLSLLPNLTILHCGENELTKLDLTKVPNLETLACGGNFLTELDIRPLRKLKGLGHLDSKIRIIQRPDQNFK